MKKILFGIIIFLLTIMPVYAKETTISVTNAEGKKDSNVKVQVILKDNPGFGLLGIKIDYDSKLLSYEKGKLIGLDKALMKDIKENDGTITIYAFTISKLIKDSGAIAEMNFKIKNNNAKETNLKIDVTDFGVDENTTLKYKTKDGIITIKDGKEQEKKEDSNNNQSKEDNKTNNKKQEEKKEPISEEEHEIVSELPDTEKTFENKEVTETKKLPVANKKTLIPIIFFIIVIIVIILVIVLKNKKGANNDKSKKDKKIKN